MVKKIIISSLVTLAMFSCVNTVNATIPFGYQRIEKKQEIMALSRESVCSDSCSVGQQISFKIMEDIKLNDKIVVPSGSVAVAKVTKVKQSKRLSRHGVIEYEVNELQFPTGYNVHLKESIVKGHIVPIEYKDAAELATEKAPISAASYATTFALDAAADVSSAALLPIGMGVSVVAGFITGYFDPDKGCTKIETAKRRAYYNTPIGMGHVLIAKGCKAQVHTGQSVMLSIKKSTLQEIQKQTQ